jgi:hypothetical protein
VNWGVRSTDHHLDWRDVCKPLGEPVVLPAPTQPGDTRAADEKATDTKAADAAKPATDPKTGTTKSTAIEAPVMADLATLKKCRDAVIPAIGKPKEGGSAVAAGVKKDAQDGARAAFNQVASDYVGKLDRAIQGYKTDLRAVLAAP